MRRGRYRDPRHPEALGSYGTFHCFGLRQPRQRRGRFKSRNDGKDADFSSLFRRRVRSAELRLPELCSGSTAYLRSGARKCFSNQLLHHATQSRRRCFSYWQTRGDSGLYGSHARRKEVFREFAATESALGALSWHVALQLRLCLDGTSPPPPSTGAGISQTSCSLRVSHLPEMLAGGAEICAAQGLESERGL